MRSLTDMRAERGKATLWCGPTLIARLLGISYADAENEYRKANQNWYKKKIVGVLWKDTIKILSNAGKLANDNGPLPIDEHYGRVPVLFAGKTRTTLRQWIEANRNNHGLYVVRTRKHVQMVNITPDYVGIHDNNVDGKWFPGMKRYSKIRCLHARKVEIAA